MTFLLMNMNLYLEKKSPKDFNINKREKNSRQVAESSINPEGVEYYSHSFDKSSEHLAVKIVFSAT